MTSFSFYPYISLAKLKWKSEDKGSQVLQFVISSLRHRAGWLKVESKWGLELGLSDVANKITEYAIKFEYKINNENFLI